MAHWLGVAAPGGRGQRRCDVCPVPTAWPCPRLLRERSPPPPAYWRKALASSPHTPPLQPQRTVEAKAERPPSHGSNTAIDKLQPAKTGKGAGKKKVSGAWGGGSPALHAPTCDCTALLCTAPEDTPSSSHSASCCCGAVQQSPHPCPPKQPRKGLAGSPGGRGGAPGEKSPSCRPEGLPGPGACA